MKLAVSAGNQFSGHNMAIQLIMRFFGIEFFNFKYMSGRQIPYETCPPTDPDLRLARIRLFAKLIHHFSFRIY